MTDDPTLPLVRQRCVACEGGTPPLGPEQARELHAQLTAGSNWTVGEIDLQKTFTFKTFPEAIRFVDKIAELAESEGHHPDLDIRYRRVMVHLTTHAIKGLSRNDFILAAKIEQLEQSK